MNDVKTKNGSRFLTLAFVGNPNCGKTTLFNAYTGANLKVANWPGVTVEKKEGVFRFHDEEFVLVDLPGTYSLTSYTMEEKLSRGFIMGEDGGEGADVIINVADASALERNLYLTLQLIELGRPVVLALNMMDIVEKRGMELDIHRLPEMLGIPVIPVSARRGTGLEVLMHAAAHHKDASPIPVDHHHDSSGSHVHDHHSDTVMVYSDDIEDRIDTLLLRLAEAYPEADNPRWIAIKLLEHDTEIMQRYRIDVSDVAPASLENVMAGQRYDFIGEIMDECLLNKEKRSAATDKIDGILAHPVLGMPVFFAVMAVVFALTFSLGDLFSGLLESGLDALSATVSSALSELGVYPWLISLAVDGIIAGVGGILTFLPNIFILFLALALLEDSGYMSRVAYVMDSLMSKLGLSGRAFIPMLLGFGCTVPAIMASRVLEDRRDRMRVMLVTPFMSCSARLPVYVLLSGLFFGKYAGLAALSMYVVGFAVAVIVAKLSRVFDKSGGEEASLLIELPEYKLPSARTVLIYVWEKIKDFLTKAGTVIFLASVILWIIMSFGPSGMTDDPAESFAAIAGRSIAPVLAPAGLGIWQVAVALICGIAAKELVVSGLCMLFGGINPASSAGLGTLAAALSAEGFGAVNAYSLMLFVLLYIPCAATFAAMRSEMKSTPKALGAVGLQLGIAYAVSVIFYQIAIHII